MLSVVNGPFDAWQKDLRPWRCVGNVLFMSLADLEKEVRSLFTGEFGASTRWLGEYAAKRWDEQFERDVAAGKLEKLGGKADSSFAAGECTEL